jgi:Ca-activated chloride channel family protein
VSVPVGRLAWALATLAAAQALPPPVSLRLVSPSDGAYVSGPTVLRAVLDPPQAAPHVVLVTFFADGREVGARAEPPFECVWDAGPQVRARVVRAVAVLDDGRRLAATVKTRGLDVAETVDVDIIHVTATVTDRAGRFVRGLSKDDFRVFEDGVPRAITFFGTADRLPLDLVVAVDVSGSMTPAMPALKRAVKMFLGTLGPRDRATLVAFNDNLFTIVRNSADRAAQLRAVDRLAPWGGTALYDALLRALDMVGREHARRAVVAFTDGRDEHSFATLEDVVGRVEATDATVYMIALGEALTHPVFAERLHAIAATSGGRAVASRSPDRLERAFAEIVEEMAHQYVLAYAPRTGTRDGAWHAIRVEVAGGHTVRARQGYRLTPRPTGGG